MSTESAFFQSLPDYEDILPFLDEDDQLDFVPPTFSPDFSAAIIVDGIPVIPFGNLYIHFNNI